MATDREKSRTPIGRTSPVPREVYDQGDREKVRRRELLALYAQRRDQLHGEKLRACADVYVNAAVKRHRLSGEDVARMVGCCERTAWRALAALDALGFRLRRGFQRAGELFTTVIRGRGVRYMRHPRNAFRCAVSPALLAAVSYPGLKGVAALSSKHAEPVKARTTRCDTVGGAASNGYVPASQGTGSESAGLAAAHRWARQMQARYRRSAGRL